MKEKEVLERLVLAGLQVPLLALYHPNTLILPFIVAEGEILGIFASIATLSRKMAKGDSAAES